VSFLERNLEALAAGAAMIAASSRPVVPVEHLQSKAGAPTALYGGLLLHSRFDPRREAIRAVEGASEEACSAVVSFGFALGYTCEAFAKTYPGVPILAIEPDAGLLREAMTVRPLDALLASPHFTLLVAPTADTLRSKLRELPLSSVVRHVCKAEENIHREAFALYAAVLREESDRKQVNVNTIARFGDLWIRNLFHNLPRFAVSPGVASLYGRFQGLPALVLASGPSLDEVMPDLPQLARKSVVISVDTSYRSTLSRGVWPDFLVVIDPQYWNTRHLDGARAGETLVITEGSTNPRALRLLEGRQFFMSSLFPLGRTIESICGPKGELGAGGSVATTAWDLARRLGCRPVVMAGLDLGFPARATHFRGAFFETRFHVLSDRLSPAEKLTVAYLHDGDPYPVEANHGATVLTDRRMTIYRSWFAAQLEQHPQTETWNLSRGGVRVPRMPFVTVADVLDLPDRREEIEERKAALEYRDRSLPAALGEELLSMAGHLSRLAELATAGKRETLAAMERRSTGKEFGDSLAALERVDREIQETGSRGIVSFLLQPLIRRIVETEEHDALARSLDLYKQIRRSSLYHRELLRKTMARTKEFSALADQYSGKGENPNH
jgi:hypothetical protein